MDTRFIPFVVIWAVLATIVVILAIYRRGIAEHEDDSIHVSADPAVLAEQQGLAQKLGKIDKWGKSLTIVLVVYGLALAAGYLYIGWTQSSTYVPQ